MEEEVLIWGAVTVTAPRDTILYQGMCETVKQAEDRAAELQRTFEQRDACIEELQRTLEQRDARIEELQHMRR